MNSEQSIVVQNLSKLYFLYDKPEDRLKQTLLGRFGKNYARTFWALKDISFEVKTGETVGIIGCNGSGKSTLLQIIAGTLQATQGNVNVNGRLAALLELGAGFNPEFTGRENILLNGITLGMSDDEVHAKAEAIIEFAAIGEFIDQPVKLYSSGMFVRLAFAIASSIDPSILIVDEALAVGDAGFVLKCINRMKYLRERGTSILLVTHDIQTVRSFCDRVVWLHQGKIVATGDPLEITGRYMQFLFGDQESKQNALMQMPLERKAETIPAQSTFKIEHNMLRSNSELTRWGSGELVFESCSIYSGNPSSEMIFEYGDDLNIAVQLHAIKEVTAQKIGVGIAFRNLKGLDIITITSLEQNIQIPALKTGNIVQISFSLRNILAPGDYALVINIENRDEGVPVYYDFIEDAIIFKVVSRTEIFSLVLPEVNKSINIINS